MFTWILKFIATKKEKKETENEVLKNFVNLFQCVCFKVTQK